MKIFIANFEVKPMNISFNISKALSQLDLCYENGADTIVFPKGFLFGAESGILKNTEWVKNEYNKNIDTIFEKAAELGINVICDIATDTDLKSTFFDGTKISMTDKCTINDMNIFCANNSNILFKNMKKLAKENDVIIVNWLEKTVAGQKDLWIKAMSTASKIYGTVFVLNTAGIGYTSHPDFFAAMCGVITSNEIIVATDYRSVRNCENCFEIDKDERTVTVKDTNDYMALTQFDVFYNQNPLIPTNVNIKRYCLDLFDMQSASLANRLKNIDCKKVVLNLSGGLDSTLALLVCVNAFDMLGIDKSGIHTVTMPGFGTSETTKGLAYDLCKGLELSIQLIDIKKSCTEALLSIDHDSVTPDVTFENVQARMRTLNALNLANRINALMIGTGDLSEEALGFSTYGGDHLSSYNVNCCVSKSVIRTMLKYIVQEDLFKNAKQAVYDVINIPVSPELVPHGGKILQKTEEILAPYKLIDFYIYCLTVTKIPPQDIVNKAYFVFERQFTREYITEKLKLFYKKFSVGQFKRSCAPECADITHVSLLGNKTYYPSDASVDIFLQQLQ